MDSVINDPALAQEMADLLYEKLQRARQELEELRDIRQSEGLLVDSSAIKEENEQLREELASARLRVNAALDNQDSKMIISQESENTEALVDELTAELVTLEKMQDQNLHEFEAKIQRYQEKYKNVKVKNGELAERLSELQFLADHVRAEVESINTESDSLDLKAASLELNEKPASTFLSAMEEAGDPNFPQVESMSPFLSSRPFSKLPKSICANFPAVRLLVLHSEEALWSTSRRRAIALFPEFVYHTTGSGRDSWKRNDTAAYLHTKVDSQTMLDLVCRKDRTWYYYGTYQCVRSFSLRISEVEEIDHQAAQHARNGVVFLRDQVPPVVTKFVETMLAGEAMPTQGFGLVRVGFDHGLDEALHTYKWGER